MKFFVSIILTLPLLFACQSSDKNKTGDKSNESNEILLRLSPEIGNTSYVQMAVEITPKGLLPIKTQSIVDLKLRPAQWVDDSVKFYIDFQRVDLSLGLLNQTIKYDSQGQNTNVPEDIQHQINHILSKNVTLGLNPQAEIVDVTYDGNQQVLDKTAINLNLLFVPFPKEELKPGDSWTTTQNLFGTQLDVTYLLQEVSENAIVIELQSDESSDAHISGEYQLYPSGVTRIAHVAIENQEMGEVTIDIKPLEQ